MTTRNPTEKDVKKGVQKILTKHGFFWFMPPANMYGRTGISDILALRSGVFLAIETKLNVAKNPPTAMQKGFLASINSEEGFGFVVDADRLPVLDAFLTAFDASVKRVQSGETIVSKSDEELMMNCVRSLQWEL